jgi:hypothetical protein
MTTENASPSLDFLRLRKLTDLAAREGVSPAEALRRLVDRAYEADLRMHPPVLDEKPIKQPNG